MKINTKIHQVALVSISLILFLTIVSSASATTEKCAIPLTQYAYVTNYGDYDHPDNTVSIIDTVTNKAAGKIKVDDMPSGIVVTPDGKKIITANGNNSFSIIDAAKRKVIKTITLDNFDGTPYSGAISPDGKKAYFLDGDQSGKHILTIDLVKNKLVGGFEFGISEAGDLVVSPDGTKLYVSEINDHYVYVLDIATENVTARILVGEQPDGLVLSPDGKKLYVTNSVDNTTSIINTKTNEVIKTINVGPFPGDIAITPDGKKLYVVNFGGYLGNDNNLISVIDTATFKVKTIKVGTNPMGIMVSEDGKKLFVVNSGSNNVSIIDTATNKVINTVKVGKEPIGIAMAKQFPQKRKC
jgi:YVTN family beta-propeller protein